MPNFFALSRTDDPSKTPIRFVDIDEELCSVLGVQPDPVLYYHGWYDFIGFGLATGRTWPELRAITIETGDEVMTTIVDYLSSRYTPDAWASRT
jgi:hypothetical protein